MPSTFFVVTVRLASLPTSASFKPFPSTTDCRGSVVLITTSPKNARLTFWIPSSFVLYWACDGLYMFIFLALRRTLHLPTTPCCASRISMLLSPCKILSQLSTESFSCVVDNWKCFNCIVWSFCCSFSIASNLVTMAISCSFNARMSSSTVVDTLLRAAAIFSPFFLDISVVFSIRVMCSEISTFISFTSFAIFSFCSSAAFLISTMMWFAWRVCPHLSQMQTLQFWQ